MKALTVLFTVLLFLYPSFGAKKITLCTAFYTNNTPIKFISILGRTTDEKGLRISGYGSTRETTDLERGLTTNYSRISLRKALGTTGGAKAMLEHLIRLGVVEATASDPVYAKFILLAENKNISFTDEKPHENKEVNKYLANRKYKKMAEQLGARPMLAAVSELDRNQNLYFLFLSVFQSIKDHDVESRDAINASLTEIGRARERGQPLIESINLGMSSLKAYATYIPQRIEIPDYVDTAVGFIPLNVGTIALEGIRQALNFYSGGSNREQKQQVFEVGKEPALKALVKGSEYFVFHKNDPRELKRKVDQFLNYYTKASTHDYFTPEFAKAAIEAYPELTLVARAQKKLSRGVTSKLITDGVFGTYSYDTYVRLARMVIVLKSCQGQDVLPHLRLEDSKKMRKELIKDLGLMADGKFNLKALDRFFVFLNLDGIADSADSFIKQFDIEHSLTQRFGNLDKEKRIGEILKRYKLASYSFARLPEDDQKMLFDALDLARQYNVLQVNRGELGAESLTHLATETWNTLSMTYLSALVTFASEGTHGNLATGRYVSLDHEAFKQWDRAAELLFRSTSHKISDNREDNSDRRLKDDQSLMLNSKGLKVPETASQEMVRMALLFDTKLNVEVEALLDGFTSLPESKQEKIKLLLRNNTVRWFHLSKTLNKIAKQKFHEISAEGSTDTGDTVSVKQRLSQSYNVALVQLAKFSDIVEDNAMVTSVIANQGKAVVNISLGPYFNLLSTRGLHSVSQSNPTLGEAEGGGLVITVP